MGCFWLYSLRRLLHGAVGVEGLKLLLNAGQRIGEFAIVQHEDGLLDPSEQVRRQSLVLVDHLLRLDGLIQDLKKQVNEMEEDLSAAVLERPTFPTLFPSTASCFILEK